jgi:hypothetical protein
MAKENRHTLWKGQDVKPATELKYLLKYLEIDFPKENEVWRVAREYSNRPKMEDIFIKLTFDRVRDAIEMRYEEDKNYLNIETKVNGILSYFKINNKKIRNQLDFTHTLKWIENEKAFAKKQFEETEKKRNVAKSYYAFKKYEMTLEQSLEVSKGFKQGLLGSQIEVYNQPDLFDHKQMREMRRGFLNGVDASVYAKKDLSFRQMYQCRRMLEQKIDPQPFIDKKYTASQLQIIRQGKSQGVDCTSLVESNLDEEQQRTVFDIMTSSHCSNILRNLQNIDKDIDLLSGKYTSDQMWQLYFGRQEGVDIWLMSDPEFSSKRMELIRHALKDNEKRTAEEEIPVCHLRDKAFNDEQISVIDRCARKGLDYKPLADPKYQANQMKEILSGIEHRVDITRYLDEKFEAEQMRQIRIGLEYEKKNHLKPGAVINFFADYNYSGSQMEAIRLAYCNNLSIKDIKNPDLSPSQMQSIARLSRFLPPDAKLGADLAKPETNEHELRTLVELVESGKSLDVAVKKGKINEIKNIVLDYLDENVQKENEYNGLRP